MGVFLVACGDHTSSSENLSEDVVLITLDSLFDSMLQIHASGKTMTLGTDASNAKSNEKPKMQVRFDYDYSLDKHEVTCGEFEKMAADENWGEFVGCADKELPITNVTFYDAVLFANAKSRTNHLDTVYSYFDAKFDSRGNCVGLEGLSFIPESDGFRLPTEAEWMFAAQIQWNPEKSWNSSNSDFALHPVCSKDSAQFCDLAGNALEWVNDWLGHFRDTMVSNFVGAADGGSLGERVVKGGYYGNAPETITLYGRNDVYVVTSATKADYVGFRLARGAIPHALWLKSDGSAAGANVTLSASLAKVKSVTGTSWTKVAFRNDISGNIAFVDYSRGNPAVVEIADTIDAYHPEISPDGSKVAFCTKSEGVGGTSALYVRNLDGSGSGLVKLNVESAAIPRWRILEGGDTAIVYVTDAGDNSDESSFLKKSTWQVPFRGGSFGEPQKLFSGNFHGGVSANGKFAVSGSKFLRAHRENADGNRTGADSIWYNEEQACNVSLAKDGSDRTLFLDFGGKTGRDFAHESYGVHERLLVADSSGRLIQSVRSPENFSFDHTEWASRGNVAVATLANANGSHLKITLVNLSDSSVTPILDGEELWHPSLWIRQNIQTAAGELDVDSVGVYCDNTLGYGEDIMRVKMRMFWDKKDSLELVAIGTSRTERGFDPLQISGRSSLNLGYVGGDLWGELYLAEHYLLSHLPKLKTIVFEISPDLQINTPFFRFTSLFNQAPGYYYDRNHDFWKGGVPKEFVKLVDENGPYSGEDSATYVRTLGLLKTESNGWGAVGEVQRDSVLTKSEMTHYANVVDSLEAFIKVLDEKGINAVGLVYPQSPLYRETGAYGRHGVPRSLAEQTLKHLDSLSLRYSNFILLDENKMGAHDYTDDMAMDYDHLSAVGAKRLSMRLDSLLKAKSW